MSAVPATYPQANLLPASYATVDDVILRYPPIGSVSAISSMHACQAIGAVQSEVDTLLGGRYTVPFSPVPPVIVMITGDMACLRLIETRIIVQLSQGQMTADQGKAWTEQLRHSGELLKGLASGSYTLLSGSGTPMPGPAVPAGAAVLGEVWHQPLGPPAYVGQPWFDTPYQLRPQYGYGRVPRTTGGDW